MSDVDVRGYMRCAWIMQVRGSCRFADVERAARASGERERVGARDRRGRACYRVFCCVLCSGQRSLSLARHLIPHAQDD